MKLYNYFRSSASYRVRIALNLKRLKYEYLPVHLLRNGGEQLAPGYRAVNPDGLVPVFADGGEIITQSLAIIEYLDEMYPEPSLLPGDPIARAFVRSLALQIACEIHPLNNPRVLKYLTGTLGVGEAEKNAWYRHWVETGFASLEAKLAKSAYTGMFCYGDTPTLADLCLVPQVFNARRFSINPDSYPTIARIEAHAMTLSAFADAAPGQQPDAD